VGIPERGEYRAARKWLSNRKGWTSVVAARQLSPGHAAHRFLLFRVPLIHGNPVASGARVHSRIGLAAPSDDHGAPLQHAQRAAALRGLGGALGMTRCSVAMGVCLVASGYVARKALALGLTLPRNAIMVEVADGAKRDTLRD